MDLVEVVALSLLSLVLISLSGLGIVVSLVVPVRIVSVVGSVPATIAVRVVSVEGSVPA